MGLSMSERQAVTKEVASRYQKAPKKQKGAILDELVALTGYHRSYAAYVLRSQVRKLTLWVQGKPVVLVASPGKRPLRRPRKRTYDEAVLVALRPLWMMADYLCGKRLAALLKELIPALERFGELSLEPETRTKLLQISPATLDRLLRADRKRLALKSKARTKPGTLLKHQIPVRTFSEWNDQRPGFVEVDLVGHDGGNAHGDFAQTLDLTDVATGWTETQAVPNKAEKWVFEALLTIQGNLPFKLRGLDSDNDGAFINAHLLRYCEEHKITFTRSRPYRKNDNCFVEQKNYSVVRRAVGYLRYDSEKELLTLNELYQHLRLFTNFFQPVMKLKQKTRIGSQVKKTYDPPKTPCQRVLESPHIPKKAKQRLREQYQTLNPAELKRAISRLQAKLTRQATPKTPLQEYPLPGYNYHAIAATHFR